MPHSAATFFCFVYLITCLVLAGCDSKSPSEQEIIGRTYEWLEEEIERVESLEEQSLGIRDRAYLLRQYRRTAEFLVDRRVLKRPYTVAASLLLPNTETKESKQGALAIEWLEHRTHVLGVILACKKPQGVVLFKIPLFANEEWGAAERADRAARTVWRARWKFVAPVSSEELALRIGRMEASQLNDPVLELPRKLAEHPLKIAVYDLEGSVSNFVEVDAQSGEIEVGESVSGNDSASRPIGPTQCRGRDTE